MQLRQVFGMFLIYTYLSKNLSTNYGITNHQLALISNNILKIYWHYLYILEQHKMQNVISWKNRISPDNVSVSKDGLFFQTLTPNKVMIMNSEDWRLSSCENSSVKRLSNYSFGLLQFVNHKWQILMLVARTMSSREVLKFQSLTMIWLQ